MPVQPRITVPTPAAAHARAASINRERAASGSSNVSIGTFSATSAASRRSSPIARSAARWRALDASTIAITPKRSARATARATTRRPVFGVFRSAVAVAVARAERFGVIAIVDASKARHLAALRAMGLERRLAAEVALNVPMETLLEPDGARSRLIEAARACAAAGVGTVILGCTGMAHHRAAVEDAAGVPVIEPCQAAAAIALTAIRS